MRAGLRRLAGSGPKINGLVANRYRAGTSGTPPSNSVAPAVTGTKTVGQTLSCSTGTWSGDATITYAYQWQTSANGTTGWANISAATSSTYVLVSGDASQYIRCVVTATNGAGSVAANSAATTQIQGLAPTNSVAPAVTGTAQVGQTLTSGTGTWSGTGTPTYTYQWQTSANGTTGWSTIIGATASTYVVLLADLDQYLRCVVTATNAWGNASANSAATSQVIAAASFATFNPSDKTSNVTLSGGNLIVTTTGTADEQVRTITSRASGKYYFEVATGSVAGGASVGIGLASGSFTLGSNWVGGSDTKAYVGLWWNTGGIEKGAYRNGVKLADWCVTQPSNHLGFAIDLDNMKLWGNNIQAGTGWGPSGTDDPETNTGGTSLSALTGSPFFIIFNSEVGVTVTFNFGATSYFATPPSGFGNW